VWILRLESLEETHALAADLARVAQPGDLILLNGGIGSGKTAFAQGFAAALGVHERVTSPSFVIHIMYESGRLPLSHFDLYRLEEPSAIAQLGIEEYVDDGVTLIEWADRSSGFAPPHLTIALDLGARDDERIATIAATGGSWLERLGWLGEAS
jgi:tRNA threonylcarbamoyladenosine biosynthesis protein TsaE